MPLNAIGWTNEEDEQLVELVAPHKCLYNVFETSRKNILARESTWQDIARASNKPVEECKKRWRGLRDGYNRSKRMGAIHQTKLALFEKLQFLDNSILAAETDFKVTSEGPQEQVIQMSSDEDREEKQVVMTEQQVITDNEYYEITVMEAPTDQQEQQTTATFTIPQVQFQNGQIGIQKKRNRTGRKKILPVPRSVHPVKILPKPIMTAMNGPKLVRVFSEEPKTVTSTENRSDVLDKLIEKVLRENTNEIDVFFRSMAASVKKLQPNLIPKVKMEVCNVIAKYEMQSFEKGHNE